MRTATDHWFLSLGCLGLGLLFLQIWISTVRSRGLTYGSLVTTRPPSRRLQTYVLCSLPSSFYFILTAAMFAPATPHVLIVPLAISSLVMVMLAILAGIWAAIGWPPLPQSLQRRFMLPPEPSWDGIDLDPDGLRMTGRRSLYGLAGAAFLYACAWILIWTDLGVTWLAAIGIIFGSMILLHNIRNTLTPCSLVADKTAVTDRSYLVDRRIPWSEVIAINPFSGGLSLELTSPQAVREIRPAYLRIPFVRTSQITICQTANFWQDQRAIVEALNEIWRSTKEPTPGPTWTATPTGEAQDHLHPGDQPEPTQNR